jgi:formylglycine-generating enzyme required for sulfatase activity
MAGNVWQWVQDCYHENYNGAPINGSAWTTGKCYGTLEEENLQRVIRGGSWISGPLNLRSAGRGDDDHRQQRANPEEALREDEPSNNKQQTEPSKTRTTHERETPRGRRQACT